MAAVIQLPAPRSDAFPAPVAEFFAVAAPSPVADPSERPQFRVIAGGREAALRRRRPAAVYRRRRLGAGAFVTIVVTLIAAAAWLVTSAALEPGAEMGRPVISGPPPAEPAAEMVHVVQPGDTLWSIAEQAAPSGDIRQAVDRLADQAGGPTLQIGERLDLSSISGG